MTPQEIFNKVNEGEIELADLLPSDRIKLIEYKLSIGSLYSGEYPWLITRVRQLEKMGNDVREKTVTDPAHEVELRARAAYIYNLVCTALSTNPGTEESK